MGLWQVEPSFSSFFAIFFLHIWWIFQRFTRPSSALYTLKNHQAFGQKMKKILDSTLQLNGTSKTGYPNPSITSYFYNNCLYLKNRIVNWKKNPSLSTSLLYRVLVFIHEFSTPPITVFLPPCNKFSWWCYLKKSVWIHTEGRHWANSQRELRKRTVLFHKSGVKCWGGRIMRLPKKLTILGIPQLLKIITTLHFIDILWCHQLIARYSVMRGENYFVVVFFGHLHIYLRKKKVWPFIQTFFKRELYITGFFLKQRFLLEGHFKRI